MSCQQQLANVVKNIFTFKSHTMVRTYFEKALRTELQMYSFVANTIYENLNQLTGLIRLQVLKGALQPPWGPWGFYQGATKRILILDFDLLLEQI